MAVDDSYTKLLLHMNGADNGTTFTDESGKTVIIAGNACTKTGAKKFGTASAYLDGNGDYLSLADSDDFNFGNGDFTIDTWLYIDSTISGRWPGIFAQRTSGSSGISCFLMLTDKKARFEYSTNGTSTTGTTFNTTLNTNQWYHLALVRNGATITCYINGVAEATTVNIGTSTIYNSSAAVIIGWLVGSSGVDCYLKGYIDEMRFSKGIARWTANFTPPTAEYGAAVPTGRARRFAQII